MKFFSWPIRTTLFFSQEFLYAEHFLCVTVCPNVLQLSSCKLVWWYQNLTAGLHGIINRVHGVWRESVFSFLHSNNGDKLSVLGVYLTKVGWSGVNMGVGGGLRMDVNE